MIQPKANEYMQSGKIHERNISMSNANIFLMRKATMIESLLLDILILFP